MRLPGNLPGAGLILLSALVPATAAAETALTGGDHVDVTLAPGTLDTGYYVQVPQGTTHMTVSLVGARSNVDVDLLLRRGQAFSGGMQAVNDADYISVGDTNEEQIEVTFASSPPVSAGRWYLGLGNADPDRQTTATVAVTLDSEAVPSLKPLQIQVAYTDGNNFGFNSNAPYTPQDGNNADTLGEARRNAFEKAIQILESSFTSPVPIYVDAHFENLSDGSDESGSALAFAGPNLINANFPGAQIADTWYPISTVPRLAGTDACRLTKTEQVDVDGDGTPEKISCSHPVADIDATFDTDPEFGGWWYGLEQAADVNQGYDFVSVAVHEMLHGLGFLSLVDVETGAKFNGMDDVFTDQLVYDTGRRLVPVNNLTNDRRERAFTSISNLLWAGERGSEIFWPEYQRAHGRSEPMPFMYAPFTPNPGSSVSHTAFKDIMYYKGSQAAADSVDLRSSGQGLGAAYYFLRDAGWDASSRQQSTSPQPGMWYDKARNGHGFDFQKVGDNYFLTFFTYDANGNPEWYLAVGTVENGVFDGPIQRFGYDAADSPPQSAEDVGEAEITFDLAADSAVCGDGTDRSSATQLARFSFTIDGDTSNWCVEPLIASSEPTPAPDFTGHWYSSTDLGWGMTVYEQGQVLFVVLYFYDGDGGPRWMLGTDQHWHNGDQITMKQFRGFCRTCEPVETSPIPEGTLTLNLNSATQASDGSNNVTVHVNYQGIQGGGWDRDMQPIQLLSDPAM